MSIALAILLWTAVALLGLLLLLLLVPLSLRAQGAVDGDRVDGRVDLRWGGGIVRVTIDSGEGGRLRLLGLPLFRIRGGPDGADRKPRPQPEKERPEKKRRTKPWAFWSHRRTLWTASRRLLRTLHLRGRVAGTVGLADPADTAMLHGALAAVGGGERFVVDVDCDWMDETLELDGTVRAFLWPLQTAAVLLVLWLRRDVRRALRAVG